MEKLLDEGKVKAIGISNFSVKKTKELLSYARHRPAANQVELHPYFRNSDISKFCQSEVRMALDSAVNEAAYPHLRVLQRPANMCQGSLV